ncbi:MAG: glutamate--tRNA ligase [Legionellales bacterium]|nr:glutamate--tRNA ligase [Legionellales bacterium]|tara:strand:- start:9 stop:1421 length:1413 start_codon:yes stop_codon:yes gene_type:complete
MTTKTRFAPSPTGSLHIGGVRTALYSWLHARHHDGKFVLRIEDTDLKRSTNEATDTILKCMEWLGLDYDEGPYYQTQRTLRYREVIDELISTDNAYYCYCTKEEVNKMRDEAMKRGEKPRYNGFWRDRKESPPSDVDPVVRFKTPLDGQIIIDDLVQGKVVFNNKELDDLIIARADGSATYNLTVVVDDMDMGITDVIRGDDHLNNTPRQINILKSLNVSIPNYAHIPMILDTNGKKLSKRNDDASVLKYHDEGYIAEALLNYLVRLGWSKGDQEVFSIKEMISDFDIKRVNKSSSSLNTKKLRWLNQHYLKNIKTSVAVDFLTNFYEEKNLSLSDGPHLEALIEVQKNRVHTLRELAEKSTFFYNDRYEYDNKVAMKYLIPEIMEPMTILHELLNELDDWQALNIKSIFESTTNQFDIDIGKLAQPVRVAITGTGISPGIDETLYLLGKTKSLARLRRGIDFIITNSAS